MVATTSAIVGGATGIAGVTTVATGAVEADSGWALASGFEEAASSSSCIKKPSFFLPKNFLNIVNSLSHYIK